MLKRCQQRQRFRRRSHLLEAAAIFLVAQVIAWTVGLALGGDGLTGDRTPADT